MLKIIRHNGTIINQIKGKEMFDYYLTKEISAKEAVKKLEKHLSDGTILKIDCNEKEEPFIETNWYVYLIKLKGERYKVPVIWSKSKKPFLISGIITVLFFMFFVGGFITDIIVSVILVSLGLINVFKRTEINKMKEAICHALNEE